MKKCARCEQEFECGFEEGKSTCWCFALPHVIPLSEDEEEGCLCPDCLKKKIEETTRNQNEKQ